MQLARIQFGFTVSFHIIFPAITIGLASYLAVLEGCWLRTRNEVYRTLYHFWSKIFAVNFGMGVVSGLVMAYEFGTNWSHFSAFAGGITGPLLAYEVLTAFFLEAGFLGVMLFGWKRVGPELHFFATIMVAIGTLVSATWILASNSWMQTPQGYEIIAGRVVPTDWLRVIFNPSFPFRLAHMGMAAYLATALMVGASGAWHLLRGRNDSAIRTMTSMAMWMLLIAAPIQAMIGDSQGLNTLEHQPLTLFGWPDSRREINRFAVEIPHLGSLILTHSWDGQFRGLKEFPVKDRPNVAVVFWSFRVMVGLGLLMIALGAWAAWARWRSTLYHSRTLLRCAVLMGPAGIIAMLAGWITTEVGRQPWVVYGLLRTADAVTPHSTAELGLSLVLFVVVYFTVFGAGIRYLLRLVAVGPAVQEATQVEGGPGQARHALRPLSCAPDPSAKGDGAPARG